MEHVNKVAPYLEEKLDQLVEKYDFITTRRGKGLMQGLVLEGKPVGEVVTKANLKTVCWLFPQGRTCFVWYLRL